MYNLNSEATVYIPDGEEAVSAMARTTSLCFSAHQDDVEFMAFPAIAECYRQTDRWFSACVLTDGAGSPRSGIYEAFSDEDMKHIRLREQNHAATVGEYAVQFQLGYSSARVKAPQDTGVVESVAAVLERCAPDTVYTHNLADKHDTHVAVTLRVLSAIKLLAPEKRPRRLYGMEVWRSLDWLSDDEKTLFDASPHANLAAALMGVYDSQIAGGKRYDAAVLGRRAANATFFESHGTDKMTSAVFAMDLSALMDGGISPEELIAGAIERFRADVQARLHRLYHRESEEGQGG